MRWSLLVLCSLVTQAHGDPPNAKQFVEQGQQLAGRGKLAEAIAAYEAALVLAPDEPIALAELGLAQFRAKDLAKADATTREAIAHATDPSVRAGALYNLGKIQEAEHDKLAAVASYSESLRARPNGVVREQLATLDHALAATFDPFAPTRMAGPFETIDAFCSAQPVEDRECECDHTQTIAHGAGKPRAPFEQIELIRRTCGGNELAVKIAAGWYVTQLDVASPNFSQGHCGRGEWVFVGVTMHGARAAIEYRTSGRCSHHDQDWGWDERSFVVVGVGRSGAVTASPPITTKLVEWNASAAKPDPQSRTAIMLTVRWAASAFALSGTIATNENVGPTVDAVADRLGVHALVFP